MQNTFRLSLNASSGVEYKVVLYKYPIFFPFCNKSFFSMINSNNMYQEHDLKCQRHDLNKPRRMTLHINYVYDPQWSWSPFLTFLRPRRKDCENTFIRSSNVSLQRFRWSIIDGIIQLYPSIKEKRTKKNVKNRIREIRIINLKELWSSYQLIYSCCVTYPAQFFN